MRNRNRGERSLARRNPAGNLFKEFFGYDPFEDAFFDPMIDRFRNEMRSMMRGPGAFSVHAGNYPRWDLVDEEKQFVVKAATPGLKKEDLDIELDKDGILTVSGNAKKRNKQEGQNYYAEELCQSAFARKLGPFDADHYDIEKIDAKMEDGILTITIPKIKTVDVSTEDTTTKVEIQ